MEFSLGSLVRGEWRVTDAELEGPEFTVGLDGSGRLAWPIPKVEFNPEGVTIDRLRIRDGRALLLDAASGSRLALDKLHFTGELRSLAGPVRGEGSVVVAGQHYPYRVATSRIGENAAVRVRLAIDPIDRPLTAEADISITLEQGAPRFEGSLQFARPVGRAPVGAQALIIEPWRLAGRIKGDGKGAQLEQIEFQYGPDNRATKLRGNANVVFGQQPAFVGALSSPQIDLDRLLGLSEATRRRPLVAVRTLAESFVGAFRMPVTTTLTVGVEAMTLGGAVLQRVAAEVTVGDDHLDIKALELRAPGLNSSPAQRAHRSHRHRRALPGIVQGRGQRRARAVRLAGGSQRRARPPAPPLRCVSAERSRWATTASPSTSSASSSIAWRSRGGSATPGRALANRRDSTPLSPPLKSISISIALMRS